MSDSREIHIQPTPAVGATAPVQAVRHQSHVVVPGEYKHADEQKTTAATTGGHLRPAYAQVAVNPDTHDVIIRIRDMATDQVISETPSPEVQAMTKYLSDYAATMRGRRAAVPVPAGD